MNNTNNKVSSYISEQYLCKHEFEQINDSACKAQQFAKVSLLRTSRKAGKKKGKSSIIRFTNVSAYWSYIFFSL